MTDHAQRIRAAHHALHTAEKVGKCVLPEWIDVRQGETEPLDQVITIRDEMVISGVMDGFEFVTFLRPVPTPIPGDQ